MADTKAAVDAAQKGPRATCPKAGRARQAQEPKREAASLIADAELYTGRSATSTNHQNSRHVVRRPPGGSRLIERATVPFKGAVLNQVSRWWFETTKDLVESCAGVTLT